MMKRWIDYMNDAQGMVEQQRPQSVMRTMAMGLAPLPQGLGQPASLTQEMPNQDMVGPGPFPQGLDSLLPQLPTDQGITRQPHSGFMVPGDVVNQMGGQQGLYNAVQQLRGRQ